MSQLELGKQGEMIARLFLESKDYEILHCNWYNKHEELDIVALDENELVIVEVKTRTHPSLIDPLESITDTKMKHLVRAAQAYIFKYNVQLSTRFDVIIVTVAGANHELEHIEDAFHPSVN